MMKLGSESQGFTLVELVITMILTGLVAAGAFVYMSSNVAVYAEFTARSELLNEAHTALNLMGEDIRLAAVADDNNRIADANAPSPSNQFSWQSDADTLVLATVVQNEDDEILFDDPTNYISHKNNVVYYLDGSKLLKRTIAAPVTGNSAQTTCPPAGASPSCPTDAELLSTVNSFTVRYLSADDVEVAPEEARSIELSVQLSDQKYGRDITVDYTTRTVFRND